MPGMDIGGKKGLECYVGVIYSTRWIQKMKTVCKSSTWFWSQPSLMQDATVRPPWLSKEKEKQW